MNIGKRRVNAWTEVWDFPLAGSSYKAPDGSSRQSSLRRAAEKQEDLEAVVVELERYEYDGAPAYHVYFDDCDVGSVPATVAQELAQMEAAGYSVSGDDCEVYGGPEDDFPDKKYGARIYVRLRRKLTDTEKQLKAANERIEMLEECLLEMSATVYAQAIITLDFWEGGGRGDGYVMGTEDYTG